MFTSWIWWKKYNDFECQTKVNPLENGYMGDDTFTGKGDDDVKAENQRVQQLLSAPSTNRSEEQPVVLIHVS